MGKSLKYFYSLQIHFIKSLFGVRLNLLSQLCDATKAPLLLDLNEKIKHSLFETMQELFLRSI